MKRKLIWLNIALAGLIAAAGVRVSEQWTAQQEREQRIRMARVKTPPAKAVVIAPAPAPVTAGAYSEIATKMLFSKERNPTVVLEVPVAPPPKPMPPLPLLHGVMGLQSGMLALVSLKPDARSVGIHIGEKIGEFELAGLTRDEISFQWEDKTVTRSVSEMIYHAQEQAPAPQHQAAAAATPANAPSASAVGAASSGKPAANIEGLAGGYKTCSPGDNSPAGTVADGYRKVLVATPFGNSCHWEEVK